MLEMPGGHISFERGKIDEDSVPDVYCIMVKFDFTAKFYTF